MAFRRGVLTAFLLLFQIIFVIIFAILAKYDDHLQDSEKVDVYQSNPIYPMFQDVHAMMFIGFGFLMVFLKRYGFSAVGLNLMTAAFVLQWATIVRGLLAEKGEPFRLGVLQLLEADFASATILISFGALLGKASALQLLVMALFEVVFAQVNEYIGFHYLLVADVGESMFVHVFGAYFGLAVARVLFNEDIEKSNKEGSVYHSDLFAMIGTIFLWIYWPSFNGGAVAGDLNVRAVVNTYYSMTASAIAAFAISSVVDKNSKFEMVHVQNATLAGGVAIGTCAHMPLGPYAALIVGSVAGTASVLGYKYLTPALSSKLKIHDTCGVNNLHGMPGIIAAIGGAVAAALASCDNYQDQLFQIFEARTPDGMNSDANLCRDITNGTIEYGRSASQQGGYQMLALAVTLGIAIVGGFITGGILRLPIWLKLKGANYFDDQGEWIVPDEEKVDVDGKSYNVTSDTRM